LDLGIALGFGHGLDLDAARILNFYFGLLPAGIKDRMDSLWIWMIMCRMDLNYCIRNKWEFDAVRILDFYLLLGIYGMTRNVGGEEFTKHMDVSTNRRNYLKDGNKIYRRMGSMEICFGIGKVDGEF
jgi:hypothetical protein